MHIISSLAVVDWLVFAGLGCLVVMITITESGGLSHIRRGMGLCMLMLACAIAYILLATDPGGSLLFGQPQAESGSREKGKARHSSRSGDGRQPGQDSSGPGDGDGGEGEELKLALGAPPTPEGSGPKAAPDHKAGSRGTGGNGRGNTKVENEGSGGEDPGEAVPEEDETPARGPSGWQRVLKECDRCPSMAIVPAGTLKLGAAKAHPGSRAHEGPPIDVTFARPFWMGRHEVTRAEFAYFLAESGYRPRRGCVIQDKFRRDYGFHRTGLEQGDDHPAVCVSWLDAKAYVKWLAETTKRAYRLPTEAEWEYAARAGSLDAYPWGNEISAEHANFGEMLLGTSHVGRYPLNAFGIGDMAGNVWELVEDCWSPDRRQSTADGRAFVQPRCDMRVMKGGAWYNEAAYLRPAARWANPTAAGGNGVGFRVARSVIERKPKPAVDELPAPAEIAVVEPAPAPIAAAPAVVEPPAVAKPPERIRPARQQRPDTAARPGAPKKTAAVKPAPRLR